MKAKSICTVLLFLVAGIAGCDAIQALIGSFGPNTVRVELVNNGDFAVRARIFFDDDQETIEAILTEEGTLIEREVPAGGTSSFTRDCDDLQAIIIDDADLLVIGGAGPEDSTDVLRDGDDFSCGDTLVFTFTHSDAILDFNILFEAVPPSAGE